MDDGENCECWDGYSKVNGVCTEDPTTPTTNTDDNTSTDSDDTTTTPNTDEPEE